MTEQPIFQELQGATYDLASVASFDAQHYTAYIKKNSLWLWANDSKVTTVLFNPTLLGTTVYYGFYVQRDNQKQ